MKFKDMPFRYMQDYILHVEASDDNGQQIQNVVGYWDGTGFVSHETSSGKDFLDGKKIVGHCELED
jgi:hypothetical protein